MDQKSERYTKVCMYVLLSSFEQPFIRCVDDTREHGFLHYPSHATRLQFGIWDASAPSGTSEWARGPIDWTNASARMSAVFESIEVECPY